VYKNIAILKLFLHLRGPDLTTYQFDGLV